MLYLDYPELSEEIRKRYRLTRAPILWFEENNFAPERSLTSPQTLIILGDALYSKGYSDAGGYAGTGYVPNALSQLREWVMLGKPVNFTHLTCLVFSTSQNISGILGLEYNYMVFTSSITDPRDRFLVETGKFSKKEAEYITNLCSKYGLKWFGEPRNPVLFSEWSWGTEELLKFINSIVEVIRRV